MTDFDTLLNEARMPETRHNVIELRALYYGRLYIYVAFSDQGDYEFSGYSGGTLKRPYGIECLAINDVVGRHTTHIKTDRYANVFRYRADDVLSESGYSRQHLSDDMDVLMTLDYISAEDINKAKGKAGILSQISSPFNYLLDLTKDISLVYSLSDRLWRRLLGDLGYDTIQYRTGVTLVLGFDDREDLDIIPYETFKPENRDYVRRKIDKANRLTWMTRNRFSKLRTDKTRPFAGDDVISRTEKELVRNKQALKDINTIMGA